MNKKVFPLLISAISAVLFYTSTLSAQELSASGTGSRVIEVPPSVEVEHARDKTENYPDESRLDLPPFSEAEEKEIAELVKDKSNFYVGIGREVAPSEANWHLVGNDGTHDIWQLHIHSPEALNLKVLFTEFALGQGMSVKVYSLSSDEPGYVREYRGRGFAEQKRFWSMSVPGDTVVVEFWAPSDSVSPADFPFEIRSINHRFRDADGEIHGVKGFSLLSPQQHTGCRVANSVCNYGGSVPSDSAGVARFLYTPPGATSPSGQCTGSFINFSGSGNASTHLYFLTAWHCIREGNNPEMAKGTSLDIDFEFNFAGGCAQDNRVTGQGATFIAGERNHGDYALLLVDTSSLRSVTNTGFTLTLLGWDATRYGGGALYGIHHARGQNQNYVAVTIEDHSYADLDPITSRGSFSNDCSTGCSHYDVHVTDGGLDGGASGASLLTNSLINAVYTHGDDNTTCSGSASLMQKIYQDGRVRCALEQGVAYGLGQMNCADTSRPSYGGGGGGGGGSAGMLLLAFLAVLLGDLWRRRMKAGA